MALSMCVVKAMDLCVWPVRQSLHMFWTIWAQCTPFASKAQPFLRVQEQKPSYDSETTLVKYTRTRSMSNIDDVQCTSWCHGWLCRSQDRNIVQFVELFERSLFLSCTWINIGGHVTTSCLHMHLHAHLIHTIDCREARYQKVHWSCACCNWPEFLTCLINLCTRAACDQQVARNFFRTCFCCCKHVDESSVIKKVAL